MGALNLVIFGPPGAGKGTQSEALKDHYRLAHLSTGDMLREAVKNETETGVLAKQYMDGGKLVPDEVVIKIIEAARESSRTGRKLLFTG